MSNLRLPLNLVWCSPPTVLAHPKISSILRRTRWLTLYPGLLVVRPSMAVEPAIGGDHL